MKIRKWISEFIENIKLQHSLAQCYKSMEYHGNAIFGWCNGRSEGCEDCPHFIGNCTLSTNSRGERSKEGEYYP